MVAVLTKGSPPWLWAGEGTIGLLVPGRKEKASLTEAFEQVADLDLHRDANSSQGSFTALEEIR